jgi:hypothetical protein
MKKENGGRYQFGMAIDARNKSRRRSLSNVDGEEVRVRIERPLLSAIAGWIAKQPEPRPSRPEAIRRILSEVLGMVAKPGPIAAEDLNASNDE